ncbi:hypothetical protein JTE90_019740 [Oedothorax gibbosus]|uniref:TAF1C beta-propeller domain-containing protein n=1 Tax=Oedothorax gibbosus TaxID=931172 RepID=A0AAV6UM41_9ARAC|nr:hypothetical protein JTE90_019740 [Oedothorax gibbosus]
MGDDWTSNLPKLLPSWQSCTPNYLCQLKAQKYRKHQLPDYGGTGVDVFNAGNEFKFEASKYGVDQVTFGAQVCALPSFTNGKAYQFQDPCLESIAKQLVNFESFSLKLHVARSKLNNKSCTQFRKDVIASHKLIKNISLSGEFEKISLSQNVVELANVLPKSNNVSEINYQYSGGCLTALYKDSESPILLHPFGSKLNKLAASPLIETSESNQAFKIDESKRTTFKLKGGCIQQVKSTFDGLCYIKQEKQCHLVNLESLSEVHHIPYSKENPIKVISPSPYIPTEYICIHEGENITLNDVDESVVLWETSQSFFATSYLNENPIACDFGSHPRSILYLDRKGVYAHDMRLKEQVATLFSCYQSACYNHESFMAMKRLSVNPFQHLVFSNHHLFIFDERYPNKPVLIWNHLLNGSPLYCDITTYDTSPGSTDAVILLATQESRELASFAVRTGQSRLQAISLAPPLSLSSSTDWADSMRFHGYFVDDQVIKRISNPLVGVCVVPHRGKPAFTAFQVTSVGDVFYQDFQRVPDSEVERTYKVGMGCVLSPPQKMLPHVSILMNGFDQEVTDSSTCNLNHVNIDIKDILKAPQNISHWCVMCQSLIPNCGDKITLNTVCPSCGLDELQSAKLHKRYNELDLLIGQEKDILDIPPMFNNMAELLLFTDNYSKRILDVWTTSEEASQQNATEVLEYEVAPMDVLHSANASYSAFSTQYGDLASSSQLIDYNYLTQQSSQSFFEDGAFSELQESMLKQEPMDEFVPPSQDIRPKVGETLRSANKNKKSFSQLNSSNAGF